MDMEITPTTEERSERGAKPIVPELRFTQPPDEDLMETWLADSVFTRDLRFKYVTSWTTEGSVWDIPSEALTSVSITPRRQTAMLPVRDMIAQVLIYPGGKVNAYVYSDRFSKGDFEAAADQIKGWLTPKRPRPTKQVDIRFRHWGDDEAISYTRSVDVPAWSAIEENYSVSVRERLAPLLSRFRPSTGGRLILLHGPPGTGKTYAIRAFAREWKRWCSVEYIADPETFFGRAAYMMQTLIADDIDSKRWRLLVIEDAGELLSADAKIRQGQGLSRLLNLSEGLIGQGLRVLILISTNEKLQSLNEAVARPGRTAAEIEFTALSVEESNAWLAAHGSEETVTAPMTLAELYAVISGSPVQRAKQVQPIGFIRR
jgi:hypothetical protein